MVKLFVRHQVKDFDTWHGFYKKLAELRERQGIRGEQVFRGVQDRNEVTLISDVASVGDVERILSSGEMQAALAEAGVIGAPTVWVVEPVA